MTKPNLGIILKTLITIMILGNLLTKGAIRHSATRISDFGLCRILRLGGVTWL
jgi:hypothetical protein